MSWDDHAEEEIPHTVGREIPTENKERANEIWKDIIRTKSKLKKIENEISETEELLSNFGPIVSLYLKIEWDKAKKGE